MKPIIQSREDRMVDQGSRADEAESVQDLVSVNGHPVRDIIDYYIVSSPETSLVVQRPSGERVEDNDYDPARA